MFILLRGAEVFAPEPSGRQDVLVSNGKIIRVGSLDPSPLAASGLGLEVVDAQGFLAVPGLVDPHEHFLGGSGDSGFGSQTPELGWEELARAGITTAVGCIGTDTVTRNMPALYGRAAYFRAHGFNAFLWTGGYHLPPATLTGSVLEDLLYVEPVIGAGEVAVSDHRTAGPSPWDLARLASEARVGGLLTGKAGVTHIHVGAGKRRLGDLRELLEREELPPESLYPTHIERSEALMLEAIGLAKGGVPVDIDVVDRDLAKWLRFYLDHGGPPERLTLSTDAPIGKPENLLAQIRGCVRQHSVPLAQILPMATSNTARVLKLTGKGQIAEGADADLLLLNAGLEIQRVMLAGRFIDV